MIKRANPAEMRSFARAKAKKGSRANRLLVDEPVGVGEGLGEASGGLVQVSGSCWVRHLLRSFSLGASCALRGFLPPPVRSYTLLGATRGSPSERKVMTSRFTSAARSTKTRWPAPSRMRSLAFGMASARARALEGGT